jgi:hypothetical protein
MASSESDPYLLFLEEKIRQHIETKRQDNKNNNNKTMENSARGWSPSTDFVLPFLEELRAIWINNQTLQIPVQTDQNQGPPAVDALREA